WFGCKGDRFMEWAVECFSGDHDRTAVQQTPGAGRVRGDLGRHSRTVDGDRVAVDLTEDPAVRGALRHEAGHGSLTGGQVEHDRAVGRDVTGPPPGRLGPPARVEGGLCEGGT